MRTTAWPTLTAVAGVNVVEATSPQQTKNPIDGVSLLPVPTSNDLPKREHLFCHFPRSKTLADTVGDSFIRGGDYKLIRHWFDGNDGQHRYELFDLSIDIGEQNNLADTMPERVKVMSEALDDWLKSTGALIPKRVVQVSSLQETKRKLPIPAKAPPGLDYSGACY